MKIENVRKMRISRRANGCYDVVHFNFCGFAYTICQVNGVKILGDTVLKQRRITPSKMEITLNREYTFHLKFREDDSGSTRMLYQELPFKVLPPIKNR